MREGESDEHGSIFQVNLHELIHKGERELSAFLRAVTELFDANQAKLAAEDWLYEAELMDSQPCSELYNWRAVTVAASARLAKRVNVALHGQSLAVSADTKALMIPPSACELAKHRDFAFTRYTT